MSFILFFLYSSKLRGVHKLSGPRLHQAAPWLLWQLAQSRPPAHELTLPGSQSSVTCGLSCEVGGVGQVLPCLLGLGAVVRFALGTGLLAQPASTDRAAPHTLRPASASLQGTLGFEMPRQEAAESPLKRSLFPSIALDPASRSRFDLRHLPTDATLSLPPPGDSTLDLPQPRTSGSNSASTRSKQAEPQGPSHNADGPALVGLCGVWGLHF